MTTRRTCLAVTLFVFLFALTDLATANVDIQWQPLMEPGSGGTFASLAVSHLNSNKVLCGGDLLGIGVSNDGGITWTSTFGLKSYEIAEFTFHPTDPDVIWVGTMSGPYKSTDGGTTWQEKRDGMGSASGCNYSSPIQKILFDPADASRLLAFGGSFIGRESYTDDFCSAAKWNAVWSSVDGGDHWSINPTRLGVNSFPGFVTATYVGTTLCASLYGQGVYRKTSSGSWTLTPGTNLPNAGKNVWCLERAGFSTTTTVYAAVGNHQASSGGIYKSTDAGLSWAPSSTGLEITDDGSGSYRAVRVCPSNPSVLYTGNGTFWPVGVYRSVNAGANWTRVMRATVHNVIPVFYNGAGPTVLTLAVPANATNVCYMGNTEYILKSTNPGDTSWFDITSDQVVGDLFKGNGFSGIVCRSFEFHPYDSSRAVFQGMDGARFCQSRDSLTTWRRSGQGPSVDGMDKYFIGNDVDFAGTNGDTILITTGPNVDRPWKAGVGRSYDGGLNWDFWDFSAFPGTDSTSLLEAIGIYALPGQARKAWVVIQDKLYRTNDATGTTWTNVFPPDTSIRNLNHIAAARSSPSSFYLNSSGGVYKTVDGLNFTHMGNSPANGTHILVDPNDDSIVYVTKWRPKFPDTGGGLWRYKGTAWTRLLTDEHVYNVAVNPSNSNIITVITNDHPFHDHTNATGVWLSVDGGNSWTQQNSGLPVLRGEVITFNPHDPLELICGTTGRGFFRGRFVGLTGVEDPVRPPEKLEILLSPNPMSKSLTVSCPSGCRMSRIELFDVSGRRMRRFALDDGRSSFSFDVGGVPRGVYFVRVRVGEREIAQKVVRL